MRPFYEICLAFEVFREMLVTEPLERRRYREAHRDIPWCFLICHGWHGVEEDSVMWENLRKKTVGPYIEFGHAPHNVPPGETYFSWFSQNVLEIAIKRGRMPDVIVDADNFDASGHCCPDHRGEVEKLKAWAEQQGVRFVSMTRDELYAGAWPQKSPRSV